MMIYKTAHLLHSSGSNLFILIQRSPCHRLNFPVFQSPILVAVDTVASDTLCSKELILRSMHLLAPAENMIKQSCRSRLFSPGHLSGTKASGSGNTCE